MQSAALLRNWAKMSKCASISLDMGTVRTLCRKNESRSRAEARTSGQQRSIDRFRRWAIPPLHNQRLTIGPRWTRQSARTICLVARQGLSADPARTPTCCWQDHHVAGGRRAAGVPADLFSTRHCGSRPARHVCECRQACGLLCKLPKKGDEPKSALHEPKSALQDAQQHGSNDHVSAKQQSAQAADKSKAAHDHSTQANNKSQQQK